MSVKPEAIVEAANIAAKATREAAEAAADAKYFQIESTNAITDARDYRDRFVGFGQIIEKFLQLCNGILEIFVKIGTPVIPIFNTIIKALADNVLPFVVFVIGVALLLSFFLPNKKNKNKKNVPAPPSVNFFNPLSVIGSFNPLSAIGDLIPIPTYKMKLLSYNFAPYSSTVTDRSISDRPKIIGGRCDNLKKHERSGACFNTTTPDPIIWTLDIESMPELNEVSANIKSKLDSGAEKYIVTIPWAIYKKDGVHYYPDCKKATFGNGDSAAYLFTDKGTKSCEKVSVARQIHGEKARQKYMSDKYTGLDVYVAEK